MANTAANTSVSNTSQSINNPGSYQPEPPFYQYFFVDYFYYYFGDFYTNTPNNFQQDTFYQGNFYDVDQHSISGDSSPLLQAVRVIGWLTFAIGLPLTCLAAIALYRQIKPDQVAPLYVINLLISDLVQIIIRPALMIKENDMAVSKLFYNPISQALSNGTEQRDELNITQRDGVSAIAFVVFHFGILTSIGFMVCISLERYLLVAHPLWYHCHRTIKHSVLVSAAVWVAALAYLTVFLVLVSILTCRVICVYQSIFFFLPFPLFLFFIFATWRSLSHSIAVSNAEKRRILGTLGIVLANYTLVFLPSIVFLLWKHSEQSNVSQPYKHLNGAAMILLFISPLLDILLYIFMGKSPKEILAASNVFRRWNSDLEDTRTVPTVSELVSV